MIRVVNLSPAIDVTYQMARLVPGESLRVERVMRTPGGKGVNVARVISAGGQEVELVVPLGGKSGDWLRSELAQTKIQVREIPIANETRTCVVVSAAETTVLNEPAAEISESEFAGLLELCSRTSSTSVLSGSLPKNLSRNQIAQLIGSLRQSSDHLIVDTSGAGLLLAAELGADLIKPNRQEAMQATDTDSPELAVAELLALGAKAVLLSDGEDGALLARSSGVLRAKAPVQSGNPTGAGDAMVAVAAIGMQQGQHDRQLLEQSVAAGALAVTESVAGVINWSRLDGIAQQVEIEE